MTINLPRPNTYNAPLLIHLQRDGAVRLNPYLVAREFERLGRDVVWTSSSSFYVLGSDPKIVIDTTCPAGHSIDGRSILDDKIRYKTLLAESGLRVPAGRSFSSTDEEEAREFCRSSNRRLVVKPSHGNKSQAVTVGLHRGDGFDEAWKTARKHNANRERNVDTSIIIEEHIAGEELRFLVVGGQCVGIYHKMQSSVVGNGRDSVGALIEQTNAVKSANPTQWDKPITIDRNRSSIIEAQGHDSHSIPKRGEVVILDNRSSVSAGAHTFAVTDGVHESFKDLAVSAASLADGAPVVGIDMLIEDFTRQANATNYAVLEGNARPGLGPHHFPTYGKPNNVARHIAAYCLRNARDSKVGDETKFFSVVAMSTGEIDRGKVENVLQASDVKIRSMSSDEGRLRIYIDESADMGVLLSRLLREALPEQDTAVLMEQKRYGDCAVRIVVQGPGTQDVAYRQWLKRQSELRGVNSDVRTLASGDVEAILSGEKAEVGNLVLKCGLGLDHQSGRKVSLRKIDEGRFKFVNDLLDNSAGLFRAMEGIAVGRRGRR